MSTFVPRKWLRNGHIMTIVAWARGRRFDELPAPAARLFQVTSDTPVKLLVIYSPPYGEAPDKLRRPSGD